MSLLGLDNWVVRSPEPIAAEVGDGLVMLSVQEGKYFSLNPSAAAIWRRLESPTSVRELRDGIVEEFDVSVDQATPTLLAFLAKLIDQKIAAVPGDLIAIGVEQREIGDQTTGPAVSLRATAHRGKQEAR